MGLGPGQMAKTLGTSKISNGKGVPSYAGVTHSWDCQDTLEKKLQAEIGQIGERFGRHLRTQQSFGVVRVDYLVRTNFR